MTPDTARRYAWLLRPDVRKATAAHEAPNEAFDAWWLSCGRREYPAYAELSSAELAWLREPVGQLDLGGGLMLQVPRAMRCVLQYRPDVRKRLGERPLALAGWFLANGLHEHLLLAMAEQEWVRALDAPLPGMPGSPEVPRPTALMALAWQMLEAEQRAALPLEDPQARMRYLRLFFGAVGRSPGLQALLARRWHAWLQYEVPQAEPAPPLPRWQALRLPEPTWLGHQAPARPEPQAAATRGAAAGTASGWRERPFGVNLYGFAFGELGIGEDVRMAVQACEAAGIPHRVVNVDPGTQLRQADRMLAEHVQRAGASAPYAFNVFCMPGFDMVGRVLMRQGPQLLDGHCNIGWWPWELPVWPARWKPAFDFVQEVWAATTYTQAMYEAASGRRVPCMPLPAAVGRVQPQAREALGLPPSAFLYLYVFDLNSWLPRKNPWAVIEAFERAWPQGPGAPSGAPLEQPLGPARREGRGSRVRGAGRGRAPPGEVGLVLKTMNGRDGHPLWEAFKERCARDPRIVLLDRTMDRGEVLGLIGACDAYVSLHRAEGFGRTLAEAMLLGKPVVATDFSGNTDFLTQEVGFPVRWSQRQVEPGDYLFVEPDDDAWWAEPDVAHAAEQMLAAHAAAHEPAFLTRLQAHAEQVFSPARVGALMRERLMTLYG
jgi:glycosyltransferase involved in cell wall biosynthesis